MQYRTERFLSCARRISSFRTWFMAVKSLQPAAVSRSLFSFLSSQCPMIVVLHPIAETMLAGRKVVKAPKFPPSLTSYLYTPWLPISRARLFPFALTALIIWLSGKYIAKRTSSGVYDSSSSITFPMISSAQCSMLPVRLTPPIESGTSKRLKFTKTCCLFIFPFPLPYRIPSFHQMSWFPRILPYRSA